MYKIVFNSFYYSKSKCVNNYISAVIYSISGNLISPNNKRQFRYHIIKYMKRTEISYSFQ